MGDDDPPLASMQFLGIGRRLLYAIDQMLIPQPQKRPASVAAVRALLAPSPAEDAAAGDDATTVLLPTPKARADETAAQATMSASVASATQPRRKLERMPLVGAGAMGVVVLAGVFWWAAGQNVRGGSTATPTAGAVSAPARTAAAAPQLPAEPTPSVPQAAASATVAVPLRPAAPAPPTFAKPTVAEPPPAAQPSPTVASSPHEGVLAQRPPRVEKVQAPERPRPGAGSRPADGVQARPPREEARPTSQQPDSDLPGSTPPNERTAAAPARLPAAAPEPSPATPMNPYDACGGRVFIALDNCLRRQCAVTAYARHQECARVRGICELRTHSGTEDCRQLLATWRAIGGR
jgi:hypothetical protein